MVQIKQDSLALYFQNDSPSSARVKCLSGLGKQLNYYEEEMGGGPGGI